MKYRVTLCREIWEKAVVEVDAEDETSAMQEAEKLYIGDDDDDDASSKLDWEVDEIPNIQAVYAYKIE